MARIIKTDGEEKTVEPMNGSDFGLSEMQKIVGGYIEIVHLENGELMVVNEEGMLKNLPVNIKATCIAYQPIVGNVLVCDSNQIK